MNISVWSFHVHFTHFPYDTPAIERPMSKTGLVGKITSVNPSAIQYVNINNAGEIPITEHIGNNIGITKNILAEAEPINTCNINIKT